MEKKKISYKELGLCNSRELFSKAVTGGYAIPAYNFNNLEQMQAIILACVETKSPVILQVSKGARSYANETLLRYLAQVAVAHHLAGVLELPARALHAAHLENALVCADGVDYRAALAQQIGRAHV